MQQQFGVEWVRAGKVGEKCLEFLSFKLFTEGQNSSFLFITDAEEHMGCRKKQTQTFIGLSEAQSLVLI